MKLSTVFLIELLLLYLFQMNRSFLHRSEIEFITSFSIFFMSEMSQSVA